MPIENFELQHFMVKRIESMGSQDQLGWTTLANQWNKMNRMLQKALAPCGQPGKILLKAVMNKDTRQKYLLGGRMNWPESLQLDDKDIRHQCGQAEWMLSKAVKNCLVACWRQRAYLRGDQNECETLGWKLSKPRPVAKYKRR